MEKRMIVFDMDGTLCEWDSEKSIEEIATPGYFRHTKPITNMINALLILLRTGRYEVFINTAVFPGEHYIKDKKYWIETHIPEFPMENFRYVEYGHPKSDAFSNHNDSDILVDDFTPNLVEWHGRAIKFYNGINGTKGTWKGYSVDRRSDALHLATQIASLANI